jgi:hypothetical protein
MPIGEVHGGAAIGSKCDERGGGGVIGDVPGDHVIGMVHGVITCALASSASATSQVLGLTPVGIGDQHRELCVDVVPDEPLVGSSAFAAESKTAKNAAKRELKKRKKQLARKLQMLGETPGPVLEAICDFAGTSCVQLGQAGSLAAFVLAVMPELVAG